MVVDVFVDDGTETFSYLVWDRKTLDALVIDPVLNYEPVGSTIHTESVEKLLKAIKYKELHVLYVLETHAHADHLSGSQMLKRVFPDIKIAIGEKITKVQEVFKDVFGLPDTFPTDGSQFDRLIRDGDSFCVGSIGVEAIATPGHTPACMTYKIGDRLFVGDALFMPDMGTGRCDFPAGSAEDLYESIMNRIYKQPDATRIFVGHDYCPGGRERAYETTVGAEKKYNIQLGGGTSKEGFISFRKTRDATLSAPELLYQSVQINVDGGHLPSLARTGGPWLRIPIRKRGMLAP
ncbi:MAG: MBL fold metallo-hydrolase [Myxococcales bacterium]|nr:MBL fold metallo-hydrolase [Myxococcales bacterium]